MRDDARLDFKNKAISLDSVVYFYTLLFIASIFLTPKIYLTGNLGFKLDDLLFPFTIIIFILKIHDIRLIRYKLIINAFLIYLFYTFFVTSIMIFFWDTGYKYSVPIFLKELQFFATFLIILASENQFKKFDKMVWFMILVNIAWVLFQITTGYRAKFSQIAGEERLAYGIGALSESSPASAGIIFLCSFWICYLRPMKNKILFLIILFFSTLFTISRTTILGIFISVGIIYLSKVINRPKRIIASLISFIFIFSLGLLIFFQKVQLPPPNPEQPSFIRYPLSIYERFNRFDHATNLRSTRWEDFLSQGTLEPLQFVTGMGKAYGNKVQNRWTMGMDSQFIRDLLEVGLIGLILHYFAWMSFIFYVPTATVFLIFLPILSMSTTHEILTLSKSVSGFYIVIVYALYYKRASITKK